MHWKSFIAPSVFIVLFLLLWESVSGIYSSLLNFLHMNFSPKVWKCFDWMLLHSSLKPSNVAYWIYCWKNEEICGNEWSLMHTDQFLRHIVPLFHTLFIYLMHTFEFKIWLVHFPCKPIVNRWHFVDRSLYFNFRMGFHINLNISIESFGFSLLLLKKRVSVSNHKWLHPFFPHFKWKNSRCLSKSNVVVLCPTILLENMFSFLRNASNLIQIALFPAALHENLYSSQFLACDTRLFCWKAGKKHTHKPLW